MKLNRPPLDDIGRAFVDGLPRCRIVATVMGPHAELMGDVGGARCCMPLGHDGTHFLWAANGILMISELAEELPEVIE